MLQIQCIHKCFQWRIKSCLRETLKKFWVEGVGAFIKIFRFTQVHICHLINVWGTRGALPYAPKYTYMYIRLLKIIAFLN